MRKITRNTFFALTLFFTLIFSVFQQAYAFSRGIYITVDTLLDTKKLTYLIEQSKKYGIDTFVIDMNQTPSQRYKNGIKLVQDAGLTYVARVVIFPHGGTHAQVTDQSIWNKRLGLAKQATALGAKAIQLDYIRYRAENPANPEKAKYIARVVSFFKTAVAPVPLQMDIFGVVTFKPAHTIGQDVGGLADLVSGFCPMVYPSHYEPFREHAVRPYKTVYDSVMGLKKQLKNHPNVHVYAFIEAHNYRYSLSPEAKTKYIMAEMKAAKDAGADGWYVWSANNHYDPLFRVLAIGEKHAAQMIDEKQPEAVKTTAETAEKAAA